MPKENEKWVDHAAGLSGFRGQVRNMLLPFVLASFPLIERIQKGHNKYKTYLLEFVSITGSHNFMIALFPVWFFGFGLIEIGRQSLIITATGVLLGNMLKDWLCLPRPHGASIAKLTPHHHLEYGFPSTHAVMAFSWPFYVAFTLFPLYSLEFYIACLVSAVYCAIICYSRMYLGMHTIPDLLGGVLLGAAMLYFYLSFGFAYIETALRAPYTPVYAVAIAVTLLFLHPEPVEFCPCFEDSVCFSAAAVGIIIGGSRYPSFGHAIDKSIYFGLVRYLLGMTCIILSRLLLKPIMYKVLPYIFAWLDPPRRRFFTPLQPGKQVDAKALLRPIPSITNLNKAEKDTRYDVTITSKFIVYTIMAWIGCEGVPVLFWLLNLM